MHIVCSGLGIVKLKQPPDFSRRDCFIISPEDNEPIWSLLHSRKVLMRVGREGTRTIRAARGIKQASIMYFGDDDGTPLWSLVIDLDTPSVDDFMVFPFVDGFSCIFLGNV